MPDSLPGWIPALLLALAPGGIKLWLDRSLWRRLDDPVLPERLMARRPVAPFLAACTLAAGAAVWPGHLSWMVPLTVLSLAAGGFPLRRALHGETWSLGAYLWFLVRAATATWGFWLLLAATPWLANREGWEGWAAAAALAGVLLAWNDRIADVLRVVLGARPVARPDLVARFGELVSRTELPTPRFDEVHLRGGVLANALALGSLRGSGVLVTDTLLARLAPDEVAAICAHELAHLEHFNPDRLRRLRLWTVVLILAGAVWSPIPHTWGQPATWPWLAAFDVIVLGFLIVLSHRRQQHETASDVRAVALVGDPEPLASALVKLHALARLPRRFDRAVEEHASHPSLARRIQAIRAAGLTPPASLGEASTFVGTGDSSSAVTFHADRLVWSEGADVTHTLPYPAITELRVAVARQDVVELVAADAKGRRWTLPLSPNDVARAQSVLDIVDTRISAARAPSAAQPVTVLIALLAGLVALAAGQVMAALVVLVVALDTAAPLIAAAGAAALAAAGLILRDGGGGVVAGEWWPVAVLLLAAAFLLSVALRTRLDEVRPRTWRLVAGLAGLAGLMLIPAALSSTDLLGAHLAARGWPALSVVWLAASAAMVFRPGRRLRAAALVPALLGLSSFMVGSSAFLDRTTEDPFLVASPPLREVALPAEAALEMPVPNDTTDLRLSSDGGAIVLFSQEHEPGARVHVGRMGRPLTMLEATDAQFVDPHSLVVMAEEGDGMRVSRVDVATPSTTVWTLALPPLVAPELSVDPSARTWRVMGRELRGTVVSAEGSIDGGEPRVERWSAAVVQAAQPLGASGRKLTVMDHDYDPALAGLGWSLMPYVHMMRSRSQVWRVTAQVREAVATSEFALDCRDAPIDPGTPVCTLYDGHRTHVVSLDLATRATRGLARVPEQLFVTGASRGWLTAWSERGRPVAVHLESGALVSPSLAADERARVMAGAGPWVAVVSASPEGTIARIYAVALVEGGQASDSASLERYSRSSRRVGR